MRASFLFYLYLVLSLILTPLYLLKAFYNILIGKDSFLTFFKRFSLFQAIKNKDKPVKIWIHAASLGESLVALNLADSYYCSLDEEEQKKTCFVITTVTSTAAQLINKKNQPYCEHLFLPFDIYPCIYVFIHQLKPTLGIFIESELWPCLIRLSANKCPLYLFNARLSDKSYLRWKKYSDIFQYLMKSFKGIQAQSDRDFNKFLSLGIEHCSLFGNIKISQKPQSAHEADLKELKKFYSKKPVFLVASTHSQDEDFMLETLKKAPQFLEHCDLIFVLRHPHRGLEVKQKCQSAGFLSELRTKSKVPSKETQIYLVDTLGELGTFFTLSQYVFMGGSFSQGGHNILEPAHFDNLIITGPDMSNFFDITRQMIEEKALIQIKDLNDFLSHLKSLLNSDPKNLYQSYKDNAYKFVQQGDIVLNRYLDFIKLVLKKSKNSLYLK